MGWFSRFTIRKPHSATARGAAGLSQHIGPAQIIDDLSDTFDEIKTSLTETAKAREQDAIDQSQRNGEEAIKKLKCWIEGQAPYLASCGKSRAEYLEQLWRATSALRRRGKHFEALCFRRVLLETCDQTNPEVIPLATAVAKVFDQDSRLAKSPGWGWSFGLLIEAESLHISPLPDESRQAFKAMLESVRIDWGHPVLNKSISAEAQIRANLERIERLQSMLVKCSAANVAELLLFWKAMGHWRLGSPPFHEARKWFDQLPGQSASQPVYCWCKARLAHEAANGDGAAGVAAQVDAWRGMGVELPDADKPATLVAYFGHLIQAESALGRRAETHSLKRKEIVNLSQMLRECEPRIVCCDQRIRQQVQPVVDAIHNAAFRLQNPPKPAPPPSAIPGASPPASRAAPPAQPIPPAPGGAWSHDVVPPPLPPKPKRR